MTEGTQYQVAKEHLAVLESYRDFLCTVTFSYGVQLTVCPNCNRDAVHYYTTLGETYVDDCFFDGTKWKLKGYCVRTVIYPSHGEFTRRTFKHVD